ncbi:MAG: pyruvate kinase [Planctomycetota bacterium]|jgi:pyruvate kinase|nr:MAG: pyruvate kinase [Planctomycetota bacterium]
MSPYRRTRIVATVGPASRAPEKLEELIVAGVNVFRLNMSHGTQEQHREVIGRIREISGRLGRHIAILGDLCGPKIRVGTFTGGEMLLTTGQKVTVTTRDLPGGDGLIPSQYFALANDVRPGNRILLDDGLLELRVERVEGTEVHCVVVHGGKLKDKKGMNLPGVALSTPALTQRDRQDARFLLAEGVDWLALSFVRRPSDIADLRKEIEAAGQSTPIIAKIEKPEAVDALAGILEAADGVMVARGDLGVEMPLENVPIIQADLVEQARHAAKPVIVATQMLESMVTQPRPTRAEASDVSTAVMSGADAVMLSAETATGAFPIETVKTMDRIARKVEGWQSLETHFQQSERDHESHAAGERDAALRLRRAVAKSTAQLCKDLGVRAVVVRSRGGTSAAQVSSYRPNAPIIALTTDARVARRMSLLWGVIPRVITADEFEKPKGTARLHADALGLVESGQQLLLLSGLGKREPSLTALQM